MEDPRLASSAPARALSFAGDGGLDQRRPLDIGAAMAGDPNSLQRRALEFLGVALAYFLLAKFGLALASINPSASPIWPPTGFALAIAILVGNRAGPPVFLAAFLANVTTAGSIY